MIPPKVVKEYPATTKWIMLVLTLQIIDLLIQWLEH